MSVSLIRRKKSKESYKSVYRNLLGLLLTRGVLLGILVGVYRPVLQILPMQTKKCNFSHPFSDQTSKIHIRFQIWALGKNNVIIT